MPLSQTCSQICLRSIMNVHSEKKMDMNRFCAESRFHSCEHNKKSETKAMIVIWAWQKCTWQQKRKPIDCSSHTPSLDRSPPSRWTGSLAFSPSAWVNTLFISHLNFMNTKSFLWISSLVARSEQWWQSDATDRMELDVRGDVSAAGCNRQDRPTSTVQQATSSLK